MTAHYLGRELEVAQKLAREAGSTIMSFYRRGVIVEHKAGNTLSDAEADEPVTIADRAADALIVAGLRSAFPDDGILSEEAEDDLSRLGKDRVWIVDPLDGTTEFIAETGEFAVQIALAEDGFPVLGVVYHPVTGKMFHARRCSGAYHVCGSETERMQVSNISDPGRMRLVASRAHFSPFIDAARGTLGIECVERVGSVGLKVGLVASGAADLYLATTVAKEWDICAPHAILLEAGGELSNLCGEPVRYNKPDIMACRGLVASNGQAHSQIVGSLAPMRAEFMV